MDIKGIAELEDLFKASNPTLGVRPAELIATDRLTFSNMQGHCSQRLIEKFLELHNDECNQVW